MVSRPYPEREGGCGKVAVGTCFVLAFHVYHVVLCSCFYSERILSSEASYRIVQSDNDTILTPSCEKTYRFSSKYNSCVTQSELLTDECFRVSSCVRHDRLLSGHFQLYSVNTPFNRE